MLNLSGVIKVRIVLILLRVFAGLVVSDAHLHPVLIQVVKVRRPTLLQELEERLFEISFAGFVQSSQVFDLEFSRVKVLLVCERCKQCSVGELISSPVSSS